MELYPSGRELLLTGAVRIVLEYATRFQNMESELENALRDSPKPLSPPRPYASPLPPLSA
jgi:hypothetical protein